MISLPLPIPTAGSTSEITPMGTTMTHPIQSMIYVVLSQHGEVLDCGSKTREQAIAYARYLLDTDRIAAFDAHDFSAAGAASLRDVTDEILWEAHLTDDDNLVGQRLGIWPDDEDGSASKADHDLKLAREYAA